LKLLAKILITSITIALYSVGGYCYADENEAENTATQQRIQYFDNYTQTLKREVINLGRYLSDLAWVGAIRSPETKPETRSGKTKKITLSVDLLSLGQTLLQLEDGLLTPPGFQLTVFLSLDTDETFILEGVDLDLDGKAVQSRKYTAKEVSALQMGGAHRLFIANLAEGKHQVTVRYAGNSTGNSGKKSLHEDEKTFNFEKTGKSKTIELKLESLFGSPKIIVKEWD